MNDGFKRIVEKARCILEDAPNFANDRDKTAMLNQRFRLDKTDCKNILKFLKSLK
jgi:hypothetical protein